MNLIIVESPTKARTLAKFLGDKYTIEASMGHVRDLPEGKLGIDVDHDFAPDYVVSEKKKATVDKLTELAHRAEKLILATDPDREGEAIAWHLASLLTTKTQRITFHEITESAIKEALSKPGEINMPLVDAQQARRVLDRLVGYKLSPLLWRKIRRGLSAGRVQSVAVRLIVEREREVKDFKPVEYWELAAQFSGFEAKLKQEIKTKEEAEKIIGELKNSEFVVKEIVSKEIRRSPYPPFTTSTMQQAAANLFGWGAKRTMQLAQTLYEQGLITYHRTDSTNLAAEAAAMVREFIVSQYGKDYLPEYPRFYKTKSKVAQEAHEAIRPTQVLGSSPSAAEAGRDQGLDRDQKKLSEIIWKRFVACQMTETVSEQKTVDISAGNYLFRANGNKILFDGWQKLFDREDEDKELPALSLNQVLKLLELIPSQHFTEPPARFTEASLIKALEEYGIGRPSTYAPIISTIQERFYVEKIEKKLQPTALGIAVNDFLMATFPDILDYKFTAGMEDNLDAVANGEKKWVPVVREFYDPFSKKLAEVTKNSARVKVEVETTSEICPDCHSPLVIRIGRFGRFLACSKFPECKFTKTFAKKLDIKCSKCGGDVVMKRTKNKKSFYGCSNYPKCDFASWTKPKIGT